MFAQLRHDSRPFNNEKLLNDGAQLLSFTHTRIVTQIISKRSSKRRHRSASIALGEEQNTRC